MAQHRRADCLILPVVLGMFLVFVSAISLLSRITVTSPRQTSLRWDSRYCWQLGLLLCLRMEMNGTALERGNSLNYHRSYHLLSDAYFRYSYFWGDVFV